MNDNEWQWMLMNLCIPERFTPVNGNKWTNELKWMNENEWQWMIMNVNESINPSNNKWIWVFQKRLQQPMVMNGYENEWMKKIPNEWISENKQQWTKMNDHEHKWINQWKDQPINESVSHRKAYFSQWEWM